MSQSGNSEASTSQYHAQERKKSNLAFAFFCLDKERARDMEVFYAFCRLMDDIADEETRPISERHQALQAWKKEIELCYLPDTNPQILSPLGREMQELCKRRSIPQQYIQDIIDGVLTDTQISEFKTFDEVRKYCYGVASAVGLASIYIFGFKSPHAKEFAITLGYALQFTNMLRDVVDDAKNHSRVYVPTEDLQFFGVSKEDLANPQQNPNCKKLFAFMYFRAKHFFNKARRLLPPEDKRAFVPALIMWAIYEKILETIKNSDFNITQTPIKLSKSKKILLALRAIRESKRPEPANKNFGKLAVLGAGIAGIGAAVKYAKDGFDVSLYESRSEIGGRATSISWQGMKLDNGTHALMGCYHNFFEILNTLSTHTHQYYKPVERMQFLFPDGTKLSANYKKNNNCFKKIFDFLDYRKLKGFMSIGNISLLLRIKIGLACAKENEKALNYLKRNKVADSVIENFWRPFCVSALNTSLEETDAILMRITLKKSILGSGDSGILQIPQAPISDSLTPALHFIKGVGGNIYLNESVKEIIIEDRKVIAIKTDKCDMAAIDFLITALSPKNLKKLLPESSELAKKISELKYTEILNVYFTTKKNLTDSEYACIVGSKIHWIFNYTRRIKETGKDIFMFGVTVSANKISGDKNAIKTILEEELQNYFGKFEIEELLPLRFSDATISADSVTNALRPKQNEFKISNASLIGDWTATGLPATIESAAKSVNLINL